MNITTVKLTQNGYLVNGNMSVPNSEGNRHYQEVQKWLLGKTPEWLVLEETYNQEVAANLNWADIQSYEEDLSRYVSDAYLYENWEWSEEVPEKPVEPLHVQKPNGYYTQEEVDASSISKETWQVGYDAWIADTSEEKPLYYWIKEPEVYVRPSGLTEPTITTLPEPLPNVPEPSKTEEEFIADKRSKAKSDFAVSTKQGFTTTSGIKYDADIEDILKLKGAYDLSVAIGSSTVTVRDFDNVRHILAVADLWEDIKELGVNYQGTLQSNWDTQESADNVGYSEFVADERIVL